MGLSHNQKVPTPIPNLPKISKISCGYNFTVCVDYEGFIWSFGENYYGQLGTGTKTNFNVPQLGIENKPNFNVPQKLLDIHPVLSVSCGFGHIDHYK